MRYLLRANTISRTETRASISTACQARCLGNSIFSTKFFARQRLLACEKGFYELAKLFCHVGPCVSARQGYQPH